MNKKYLSIALTVAVAGTMVAAPVFAVVRAPGNDAAPMLQQKIGETFCSRLGSANAAKETKMAELENRLSLKRSEQAGELEKRRLERENKLAEKISESDSKRLAGYEKLLEKATTDEQKAAVEQFKLTVETAVSTRRAAIDLAVDEFRAGLDSIIAERKTANDAALTRLKAAIKTAEGKAEADCGAGIDPATVRTQLRSSIEAARNVFKTERESMVKIGEQVKTLNTARKTAFDKAKADFKATVESAINELKAVFPVKGPANSTTTATVE